MEVLTIAERIEAKISELAAAQDTEPEALSWVVDIHEKSSTGGGLGARIDRVDSASFDEDALRASLNGGTYWLRLLVNGRAADNIPMTVRSVARSIGAPPIAYTTPPSMIGGQPMQGASMDLGSVLGVMIQGMQSTQNMLLQLILERSDRPTDFEQTLKFAKMLNTAKGGSDADDNGDIRAMVTELLRAVPSIPKQSPPPPMRPAPAVQAVNQAADPLAAIPTMVHGFLTMAARTGQDPVQVGQAMADQLVLMGVPIAQACDSFGEPGSLLAVFAPNGIDGVNGDWLQAVELALRETVLEDNSDGEDGGRAETSGEKNAARNGGAVPAH